MIKPLEFYFDFISPYSFLAHKQIIKIQSKENIKIIYSIIKSHYIETIYKIDLKNMLVLYYSIIFDL